MAEPEFLIAGRLVGPAHSPFVIAEIGSNYDQDLDKAYTLIDAAANAGADCVKFQIFRADAICPDGGELHAVFQSLELDPALLPALAAHAKLRGVLFSASPFDLLSLERLLMAGAPFIKVASSEATNARLLAVMARTGLPLLLSTGMCDMADVAAAVALCRGAGNAAICLLQCGAVYPLPPEDGHLRVMDRYASTFGLPVGLSDHTMGLGVPVAAVGRGACIIEKHITLDRAAEGPDHAYALEPDDFAAMVAMIREAYAALGSGEKQMLPQERERGRRKGLYAARDLAASTELADADLLSARPATGIRARDRDAVLGARLGRAVAKGDPLYWTDLEQ